MIWGLNRLLAFFKNMFAIFTKWMSLNKWQSFPKYDCYFRTYYWIFELILCLHLSCQNHVQVVRTCVFTAVSHDWFQVGFSCPSCLNLCIYISFAYFWMKFEGNRWVSRSTMWSPHGKNHTKLQFHVVSRLWSNSVKVTREIDPWKWPLGMHCSMSGRCCTSTNICI